MVCKCVHHHTHTHTRVRMCAHHCLQIQREPACTAGTAGEASLPPLPNGFQGPGRRTPPGILAITSRGRGRYHILQQDALFLCLFPLSVGISYFRILILFARNSQSLLMQLLKGHFKYSLYKLISTESLLPLLKYVLQNACCLC